MTNSSRLPIRSMGTFSGGFKVILVINSYIVASRNELTAPPTLPAKINASGVTKSLLESTLFFVVFYSRQQAQKAIWRIS